MQRGEGNLKRSIAFYYYLQSLTHDLKFAADVDEIVFQNEPEGRRSWDATIGLPVFSSNVPVNPEEKAWESARKRWNFSLESIELHEGLLATLLIEATQSNDTTQPVALIADINISPLFDDETGIEIRFQTVKVIIDRSLSRRADLEFLTPQTRSGRGDNHLFRIDNLRAYPHLTLFGEGAGLDGNYISDVFLLIYPNDFEAFFEASMGVLVLSSQIVLPENQARLPPMKTQIIKRMIERSKLPSANAAGVITLHKVRWTIKSVGRDDGESTQRTH